MNRIIGRKKELAILKELQVSDRSEFVAIYGRRRVGKTFLVREAFNQKFTFQVTALGNANMEQQLTNFHIALQNVNPVIEDTYAKNWFTAFNQLSTYIQKNSDPRKVIFFDELPWFDTPGSGFLQALEHFWNSWASARKDIILIVC
jgi:predicted AAA+ superfamily ATPase